MTFRPHPLPPIPPATAAAVQGAFPKGNLYVNLRAEFGALYTDELFADLYPDQGRPVEVAPWRLAVVLVMQYLEGLTDRQAADAVRRCLDWKYALSLELTDPGFDFTLLHDFRERLLAQNAAPRLLDTLLAACQARGLLTRRGTQRTDSTHILAAVRTLHRLECVLETLRLVLNRLAAVDPDWLQARVPEVWYERYATRAEHFRLPKEMSKRRALAETAGTDGFQLLAWLAAPETPLSLRALPAVEVLRRIWLQQFYRSKTLETDTLRWRTTDECPPPGLLIHSPYDLEARYGTKRGMHWVGYKTHLTETCDPHQPRLITQVVTTLATVPDSTMGSPLQEDLAARALIPSTHLLDRGYVDAELLVNAQAHWGIDVVGPPLGTTSRQARAGQGYALAAFALDWDAQQARCPQGHTSVKWTPGHDSHGNDVIRVRFDLATCRTCPVRSLCTWRACGPRQLTIRPQAQHAAIAAARQRQETDAFKALYAQRAGIESAFSQGTRGFALRRSRYRGLARTQLQLLITAVAMNLVRLFAWSNHASGAEQPRPAGRFARLTPTASTPAFGV